ncbi:MAG: PAS domain S-box protein [Candidatus Magasanikbacteria bacterium]
MSAVKFFQSKIVFIIFSIIFLFCGFLYVQYSWKNAYDDVVNRSVLLAESSAYNLSGVMISKLHALPEDENTEAYKSIKMRLEKLLSLDKNLNFAYIYTKKADNKIYFIADSEPATSEDYSPPGQEYTEAGPEYFEAYNTGNMVITEPYTNRWGTWESILVPMHNLETGELLAVFGVAYSEDFWWNEAFPYAIKSGIIVLSLYGILIALYIVFLFFLKTKESNKRFEDIVESSTDWIWEIDKDKKYTFVSGKVRKILGYAPEEILGKTLFDFMEKEDLKKNLEYFSKIFDERKEFHDWENWRLSKDGKKVFVKTNAVPRYDRGGEFIGYRGINEDNTLRKKAEDQITEKITQLEKLNSLMVGRELKMIELKEEIKKLSSKKK